MAVLVNGDPSARHSLSGLLRRAGLEARAFDGAEAALRAMATGAPPALIVTDVCMDGIDGWSFCRLLRSGEYAAFNTVPILVVSGTFAGDEPDRISVDIGADAFLPAPVDGDEFVRQVRALLSGRRSRCQPRVLIVEDDLHMARLLKRVFDGAGYRAETVHGLQAAREAIPQTAFDVAVVDCGLPDGEGDALLEVFRALASDCACLMISGDLSPERSLDWTKRGAAACVAKPFKPDYLVELCARARRERALLRLPRLMEARARDLAASERNFRTLYDSMTDIVVVARPDGAILHTNQAARQRLGYSAEELASMHLMDWHPSERRNEARDVFAAMLRGERDVCSIPLCAKDGTQIPVETHVWNGMWGGSSCVFGICKILTIDEEARLLLDGTFRHNPNPMAVTALDSGQFLDANEAFSEVTGYSREDVLGKRSTDLGLYADPVEAGQAIGRMKAEGRLENVELSIRRKDGTLREGMFSGEVIRHENRAYVLTVMVDITARKQAEADHERLTAAVEQAGEAIVITDVGGNIRYVNPAFTAITGYSREEALGQNPRILKSGEHGEAFYRDLWETITGGRTWQGRFVNRRKDGTLFTEDATISPVHGPSGRIVNYVAVKRDITGHLQLSAQLQQSQKMESIGRLAGGVAHDFNNRLTVILGSAEMALEGMESGHPLYTDLQAIRQAAHSAADITRRLLAFARKQVAAPRVLDLNQVVGGMLGMLQRLIGERVSLRWSPGEGLWPVWMDPAQVDQILANLCVNAVDAIGPRPGTIGIATDQVRLEEPQPMYEPEEVPPGEYVRLAVEDDGSGMDRETLAHLFEPFFTTKAHGKGTGLGLATIYGIVKQNKGFINVYSEPGHGSRFVVYLPRHKAADQDAALDAQTEFTFPPPAAVGPLTILLAEDDPTVLRLTAQMLQRLGHAVLAGNTVDEVLQREESHPSAIDLLVTDVVMPGMNGRELADAVRLRRPGVRILFVSGYTADVIASNGVLEEGVHFIQKPFTIHDLATKIGTMFVAADGECHATPDRPPGRSRHRRVPRPEVPANPVGD